MTRNQRIGLILAAVVVSVVAVVIASSSGDDDGGGQAATTTETTTQPQSGDGDGSETTPTETTPAAPKPAVTRIQIRGGEVVGGPADIKVTKGDRVRIVVSADAPDDIHLHGYDIEKPVEPGKPARFNFTADIEGIFEIESHVAEDAGRDPLVGKLTVEPS
jgi:FtsP/CotA-like multicopper oxidase with cupredoxin domain